MNGQFIFTSSNLQNTSFKHIPKKKKKKKKMKRHYQNKVYRPANTSYLAIMFPARKPVSNFT